MTRLGHAITLALSIAGVLVVFALTAITGLGAIARFLHMGGVTWSFEAVALLFLWTTAIGAVLSEIAGENVSIDGVSATSNRGPRFQIYHSAVLLIVSGALVWSGIAMLKRTGFVPTPVMRIPWWTVQSMIAFVGVCLGIIAIIRIVKCVQRV